MKTIKEALSAEHVSCDAAFAEAENAAHAKDWVSASRCFDAFAKHTEAHFAKEEQVLFPALDAAMGGRCGPTEVMCHEHAQMRDALRQMGQAVVRKDAAAYLGFSETLLMLLQQHNHKEEHVLYTMADRVLASQSAALLDRLACP